MITIEDAKRIQEAMGPCTVTYECYTPEELVESAGDRSALEYALERLRCEEVGMTRELEDESGFDGKCKSEEYAKLERMVAATRARIESMFG